MRLAPAGSAPLGCPPAAVADAARPRPSRLNVVFSGTAKLYPRKEIEGCYSVTCLYLCLNRCEALRIPVGRGQPPLPSAGFGRALDPQADPPPDCALEQHWPRTTASVPVVFEEVVPSGVSSTSRPGTYRYAFPQAGGWEAFRWMPGAAGASAWPLQCEPFAVGERKAVQDHRQKAVESPAGRIKPEASVSASGLHAENKRWLEDCLHAKVACRLSQRRPAC